MLILCHKKSDLKILFQRNSTKWLLKVMVGDVYLLFLLSNAFYIVVSSNFLVIN
jgi:hypothetical protein